MIRCRNFFRRQPCTEMKVCSTCERKYSDSLEYCLQDGTVLSALPDPNATLRLESRPTRAETPSTKRGLTIGVMAIGGALLLAVIIIIVAAVLIYLMAPGREIAANRPTNTSTVGADNRTASPAEPTKDEISKEVQQINGEIGFALVHNDLEALDRLLADDYVYDNDLGLRLTKQQILNLMRLGNLRYDFVTSSNERVEVDSSLAKAVLNAQAQSKGRLQNTPFSGAYNYTNNYEKRTRGWQLVSERAWYH